MKPLLCLPMLFLAACSSEETVAENAAAPPVTIASEEPGNWTSIEQMAGRQPSESGLLQTSPIAVDLNAMLGPDLARYRQAMATGSPLRRDGQVLVTEARGGGAYLVIYPADHALEAGLKEPGGWRTWTTPGATVPRPASVEGLRGS